MRSSPIRHHERHRLTRLAVAAILGTSAVVLVPMPKSADSMARVLLAFTIAALLFALPLIHRILRADPEQTKAYAKGLTSGTSVVDIIVTIASIAALVGVGFLLLSKGRTPTAEVVQAIISVATVASAWIVIHTMFALRYARHWYNLETNSIDFHMDDEPSYSDFLYLAFALGASFAVSDTDLKTTAIRRIALRQSWLSYLFGTVIIAATINLLAGLGG